MVILTDPRDEDDILRAKRSREKRYMFDIAFDSYNTQLDVYLATTKPLISSVLDGFNATVFAYGPTGASFVSLTLTLILCVSLTFTPTDL